MNAGRDAEGKTQAPVRYRRQHLPRETGGGKWASSATSRRRRGTCHRPPNAVIGSTAAEVAGHGFDNLLLGGMGRLREKSGCLHDLSRLAVPTLGNVFGNPRLLQQMRAGLREAFDGGNGPSRHG